MPTVNHSTGIHGNEGKTINQIFICSFVAADTVRILMPWHCELKHQADTVTELLVTMQAANGIEQTIT